MNAQSGGRLGELRDDMLVHDGSDVSPRVVLDKQGRSIHVWSDSDEVYYRLFDITDTALIEPTQLNTTTDGDQFFPDVATQPDGSFFAIWRSLEDSDYKIRGRYYDSVTGLQPTDQLINDLGKAGYAGDSGLGVSALDGGGFVVVWESALGHGADSDNGSASIQGKLIGNNGVVAGGNQFQINDYGTSWQLSPDVAPTVGGGFFATWESTNAPGDISYSIRGRHFTAAGVPASAELQINTTTSLNQWNAQVARNDDDELLVVFESEHQAETVVLARSITSSAVPEGNDFPVTTRTDIDQYRPQVAGGPHDFVVVWQRRLDGDNDIVGRLVTDIGEFDAPPFRINGYETDSQQFPAVGASLNQARVTWIGYNDLGAASNSVIGRGFVLCLFCDDFETGDKTLWSSEQ